MYHFKKQIQYINGAVKCKILESLWNGGKKLSAYFIQLTFQPSKSKVGLKEPTKNVKVKKLFFEKMRFQTNVPNGHICFTKF